jgi:hypothetical protein
LIQSFSVLTAQFSIAMRLRSQLQFQTGRREWFAAYPQNGGARLRASLQL